MARELSYGVDGGSIGGDIIEMARFDPSGNVLVTGSPGSGKSVTLASVARGAVLADWSVRALPMDEHGFTPEVVVSLGGQIADYPKNGVYEPGDGAQFARFVESVIAGARSCPQLVIVDEAIRLFDVRSIHDSGVAATLNLLTSMLDHENIAVVLAVYRDTEIIPTHLRGESRLVAEVEDEIRSRIQVVVEMQCPLIIDTTDQHNIGHRRPFHGLAKLREPGRERMTVSQIDPALMSAWGRFGLL